MRTSVMAAALTLMAGMALAVSQSPITDTWYWQGSGGWQRIALDLRADGKKLAGTITMGPGDVRNATPDRFWEFFFRPVSFPIVNGKIDGARISFEQTVMRGAGGMPAENLKYSGVVEGDRIVFTRQSLQRSGDAFVLGDHEYQFIASRYVNAKPPAPTAPSNQPALMQRTIPIHVVVRDKSDRKVSGLRPEDFVVLEGDTVLSAESFIADDAPWNVLLLFDHNLTWLESGSNSKSVDFVAASWRKLIDNATVFVDRLRPQDQFAIAAFEERVDTSVDWRSPDSNRGGNRLTVTDAPRGQKDLYGAIRWGLKKFEGKPGHRAVVVFTDGRDGRLAPRWLRSPNPPRGAPRGGVVVFNSLPQGGGLPQTVGTEGAEVLDPLFGLHDAAEAWEFQSLLSAVAIAGVEIHFVVVGAERDPEFGPAMVGRRVSGLFPGADAALDAYLAGVRSRLEMLAGASGGTVHFGANAQQAERIYSSLDQRLGVGTYHLEIPRTTSESAPRIDVRALKEGLRVSRQTTETSGDRR